MNSLNIYLEQQYVEELEDMCAELQRQDELLRKECEFYNLKREEIFTICDLLTNLLESSNTEKDTLKGKIMILEQKCEAFKIQLENDEDEDDQKVKTVKVEPLIIDIKDYSIIDIDGVKYGALKTTISCLKSKVPFDIHEIVDYVEEKVTKENGKTKRLRTYKLKQSVAQYDPIEETIKYK
jgi:hypothetical protein